MSTLGQLIKNFVIFFATYFTVTIFKCASNKKLGKKKNGKLHNQKHSEYGQNKILKNNDKEIKNRNEKDEKKVCDGSDLKSSKTKKTAINQLNQANSSKKVSDNGNNEQGKAEINSKKKIHQMNDPQIQICKKPKNDMSVENNTIVVDKYTEVDCKSILETNKKVLKKSSIREGEGQYKSLTLSPISIDSPLQMPKFPELNCVGEENDQKKDSTNSGKKNTDSEKQKNEEKLNVEKTQSISVVNNDIHKKNCNIIDDIIKDNIFEEVKKDDKEKEENNSLKLEETQSLNSIK
ncbi:Hypothetical protein SRAE_1000029100 [Strongyloides ratti]|uniref:Uncharacterized protein n=1 Tax=Strongyloides ratti TaxID=34506 RepID=A0A090KWY1_STRRB|nr:Hypothetical protein SRAE_1000029100 [Strongyloides ratti]CEF62015.1 Hypothetical protein SRAE_1000029100 [Strongyloides ratti]